MAAPIFKKDMEPLKRDKDFFHESVKQGEGIYIYIYIGGKYVHNLKKRKLEVSHGC